jgi:hypothetical protein
MADVSDVSNLLVSLATGAAYPNGTASPSICVAPVKLYAGWPVANVLDADLKAGKVHVSVYPLPTERKTSRQIGRPWVTTIPGTPTLTATVYLNQVTFGGTVSIPQNLYLLVNGKGYMYAVQPADTLASIATAFATLLQGDFPAASSTGPVLTVPGAYSVIARVGAIGAAMRELKRQEKQFQITIWAPTPVLRDAAAGPVDVALGVSSDLAFTDGSHGILLYSHTIQSDQNQKAGLYRRDLIYTVDYATTQTASAPQVIAPVLNVINQNSGQTIRTIQE